MGVREDDESRLGDDPLSEERKDWEARARAAEDELNEDIRHRIDSGLLDPDAVGRYLNLRARPEADKRPEPGALSETVTRQLEAAWDRVDTSQAHQMAQQMLMSTFGTKPGVEFNIPPWDVSCTAKPPIVNLTSDPYSSSGCSVSGTTIGLTASAWALGKWDNQTQKYTVDTDLDYHGACVRFKVPRYLLPEHGLVQLTPGLNVTGSVELHVLEPWYPVETSGHRAQARIYLMTLTQIGSGYPVLNLISAIWKTWKVDSQGGHLKEIIEFPMGLESAYPSKSTTQLEVKGGASGDDLTVWVVPMAEVFVASSNSIMGNVGKLFLYKLRIPDLRVTWAEVYPTWQGPTLTARMKKPT